MNTKTLAQLLNDCDYRDDGTLEAAVALSFSWLVRAHRC
jgi:hypothetical protein